MDRIKIKLMGFFHNIYGGHELSAEDDLYEIGFSNSLFSTQLCTFLEIEFNITVNINDKDWDWDHFRTIENIANFVEGKINKG